MRLVYGALLVVGVVGIAGWILAVALGEVGDRRLRLDPRVETGARTLLAAAVGFGMGGLSAAFAGWPDPIHLAGALGGAAAMAAVARFLGAEDQESP
ncbi:MAG TPA: hypothetical protein ENK55_10850 [Actinobacteria bacterium]|nr:hypothetical protein [Actinomycetota bacterium]